MVHDGLAIAERRLLLRNDSAFPTRLHLALSGLEDFDLLRDSEAAASADGSAAPLEVPTATCFLLTSCLRSIP